MSQANDIENRAAQWLLKRDSSRESDMPGFREWLVADPRHRAAYLRLAAAWERTAQLKRLRPEGEAPDPDLLVRRSAAGGLWRKGVALAACASVLALAIAWWLGVGSGAETYQTQIGGLSRVVLKDGSTVTLNTDTEVRVHFSDMRREVQLLHGEAQFAVSHDVKRPFEVRTESGLVRAVGTAFDVRLDRGQSMEVVVTEGHVVLLEASPTLTQMGHAKLPPTLSAGEDMVASGGNVTVRHISAIDLARHLAWQVGELSFQGETLAAAAAEFNRYNRHKLKVKDPSITDMQIGGNFKALDVDSFVEALGQSFGIHATREADGTVILQRVQGSARE
jgi:transmembrane sensor